MRLAPGPHGPVCPDFALDPSAPTSHRTARKSINALTQDDCKTLDHRSSIW
ncbi:MAG TPA: hypothetical protein VIT44_01850 [Cyclobacteriaceae bacterium]